MCVYLCKCVVVCVFAYMCLCEYMRVSVPMCKSVFVVVFQLLRSESLRVYGSEAQTQQISQQVFSCAHRVGR